MNEIAQKQVAQGDIGGNGVKRTGYINEEKKGEENYDGTEMQTIMLQAATQC